MKTLANTLFVATALLISSLAVAQTNAEQRTSDATARDAGISERMREAEQRLEEAARRVAELSSERLGALGDVQRFAFDFSNRPRLGVTIGDDVMDGPVEGVAVIGVTPGSAAAEAGLRSGDTITSINGESFSAESVEAANMLLIDFMNGVEEGDNLDIEYLRDGKVGKVSAVPKIADRQIFAWAGPRSHAGGHMPQPPNAPRFVEQFRFATGGWHGIWGDMELVELNEGLGRYFGTDAGLLIINAPKSNDFKLQDGDVIQSIDGREPSSVNHCMRILGSYQPGETLVLDIMRDKRRKKIEIEVPDDRSSRAPGLPPAAVMPAMAPSPRPAPAPRPAPRPRPVPEQLRVEIERT